MTLLSSGMRIGEAVSLRKTDFDLSLDPLQITIQGKFTKTKQTRQTYVSSEARTALLRILEKKNDNDLVFAKSENLIASRLAEERTFDNLRKRSGLTEKYPDSSRHTITIHSMRAFFHTQASIIHDEQYANALDGHQGYLMQYYRLSPEKRAELYRKLEPHLLIYGNDSVGDLQEDLLKKSQEISILKSKDSMKDEAISNLSDHLIHLENELNQLRMELSKTQNTEHPSCPTNSR